MELVEQHGDEPAWSPGGNKVAFVWSSTRMNNREIFTVNIDGSGRKRLTGGIRYSVDPSWSPDGGKIVFVRGSGGSLVVMNRDGTHERELTHRTGDTQPVWAPNGRSILFVRGEYAASPKLMKLRLRDRKSVAIAGTESDIAPDWQSR